MLRRSCALQVPNRIYQACDAPFVYQRFHPTTHISDSLPEIVDAKRSLGEGKVDSAVRSLQRAQEIFSNMPVSPPVAKERLAIAAAKCYALNYKRPNLPLAAVQQHANIHKMILRDTSDILKNPELLKNEKFDLGVFDSTCVVLSNYTHAAATLIKAQQVGGVSHPSLDPEAASMEAVSKIAGELSSLATRIGKSGKEPVNKEIYRTAPRLRAMEALLVIGATGDVQKAQMLVQDAASNADHQTNDNASIEETGLYAALQAELMDRLAGGMWGPDSMDEECYLKMRTAMDFYENYFQDIYKRRGGDLAIDMEGKEGLRSAYCGSLISASQIYMTVPREDAKDQFFPPHLATTSLFRTMPVPAGSRPMIEQSRRHTVKPGTGKKAGQVMLERALKVNRKLYAEDRNNDGAIVTLRTLACVYAELKDYLYASGLFRTAEKAVIANYGENSYERLELLHVIEHFQRRIGSVNEAAVTTTQMQEVEAAIAKQPSVV